MIPRIYAFDVEETLEVAGGPVSLMALDELRRNGHIVGLCGNWGLFVSAVADWHTRVSFLGPVQNSHKAAFLEQLRVNVQAADYVMVGNDPTTGFGNSQDRTAAAQANWRFISEADFAAGAR